MSRRPSSRYSEMPLRVADNRMSMINATPQSKDNVFGKLNIPKPQSGTSERRTSFFGGKRTSTGGQRSSMFGSMGSGAGGQRNSIYGAYGGPEKMKDPRPLHDKGFVQQCIKQLCEFLSERGFPGSITVKTLQSPSTKEFLKIFEFSYSLLDPTFQMPTTKIEEEVPRILRDLGYPFALSKSSMYSIGAPHTWPQVLMALIWLIDTVKLFGNMRDQDLLFSDFSEECSDLEEGVEYNRLIINYTSDTYIKFMQGADTFEEEEAEYIYTLKRLYNVDEALLDAQSEKQHILCEEVERLEKESQSDRLMAKRTEKFKLQTDLQKMLSYRTNLESHKANLENKTAGLSEEQVAADLQVESLKQEQGRLQHILDNQKFTPADIERINCERNELQQTISSLSRSLEEVEQLTWNEKSRLAKTTMDAEIVLSEYLKLARKLKLIPQSAENACGHDFEIKTMTEYGQNTTSQYKTQIQKPLKNMTVDVEEEFSRKANMKLSLEESLEQVKSNIADKTNDMKQLKEQIRRLDEQLEHNVQEMAHEEQKWSADVDSAENHKKLLEKKVMDGYEDALEQLKASQQQYHLVLQETKEEGRTVANNQASVFSSAVNHLTTVEKFLGDQLKRLDRVNKEVIREDEADIKQLKEMVANFISRADIC